jgi:VanZ family protein
MDSNRSPAPNSSLAWWLAHGLLLLTVYGSIIPLRYEPMPLEQAVERFRALPFVDPTTAEWRGDWIVNMIQYACVSGCYMAALSRNRRGASVLLAAALVVPLGWAVAILLEFLQLFFPPRTVSLNDILVECLGVVLGAVAWLMAGPRFTGWLRQLRDRKGVPELAAQVFPAYVGLLLVIFLMPFDLVFSREEIATKFQEGRIELIPFGALASGGLEPLFKLLLNFLAFVPVGALLGIMPRRLRKNRLQVVTVGLAVPVSIRLLQLFVYTRNFDVTNLLTGMVACWLGWWLVQERRDWATARLPGFGNLQAVGDSWRQRVQRWGPAAWIGLARVWTVVLLVVFWQPFHFTTDPSAFGPADADLSDEDTSVVGLRRLSWAPFVDYYWGSRYQTLDQIVWRTLAFASLGVLLAPAWSSRERRGAGTAVLWALVLSAMIALGQYFIPERHPSTTSLMIQVGAAWLGYKLGRHAIDMLRPVEDGSRIEDRMAKKKVAPQVHRAVRDPRSSIRGPAAAGGLRRHLEAFFDWLAARPRWVALLLICAVAMAIPIGFVWLLRALLQ